MKRAIPKVAVIGAGNVGATAVYYIAEKDLADIPEDIQKTLEFRLVETMDDVLQIALEREAPSKVDKEYEKGLDKGIPGSVTH